MRLRTSFILAFAALLSLSAFFVSNSAQAAVKCPNCKDMNEIRQDLLTHPHNNDSFISAVEELSNVELSKNPAVRVLEIKAFMELTAVALNYDEYTSPIDDALLTMYLTDAKGIKSYLAQIPKEKAAIFAASLKRARDERKKTGN